MKKQFTIRAASSPILENGFALVGSIFNSGLCPRVSYLRSHDIEQPVNETAQFYFDIGFKNEARQIEKLKAAGIEHD